MSTAAETAGAVVELDLERMRRERHARLVDAMRAQEVDVLLLLGPSNVAYATGFRAPFADAGRAGLRRAVAVVTADGAEPELRHGVDLETREGAGALTRALPGGTLAVDEYTMPLRAALGGRGVADATAVTGAARVTKTPDELECIRRAQSTNEEAMLSVEEMVAPGVRAIELSGRFLRRVVELGASGNVVDPIFQVMPRRLADGPYSGTGDVVFPTPTTDAVLEAGDVVWVDTGIDYEGYASDFGRTWVVGGEPDARQHDQFRRWRDVVDRVLGAVKPAATAADLTRAAGDDGGRRPWPAHLYLGHGIGLDSAEMPLVGTDLGAEFDESLVLVPGMVIVLEPMAWDDGHAGYRAEEICTVTDDGARMLSAHHYRPYA